MINWKPVLGLEAFYEVSDQGEVRSFDRLIMTRPGKKKAHKKLIRAKLIKPFLNADKHLYIDFCVDYEYTRLGLAQVVLRAFNGPCPEGMEACHNDGNPLNNCANNLRWDTHLNNIRDKHAHGTNPAGSRHGASKLTEADIPEILKMRHSGMTHKQIAEHYPVCRELIGGICRGTRWRHV